MSIQAFLLLLFLLLFPLGQQSFQFENCLYVETVLIFPTVKSGGNGWDGMLPFFFQTSSSCTPHGFIFVSPAVLLCSSAVCCRDFQWYFLSPSSHYPPCLPYMLPIFVMLY